MRKFYNPIKNRIVGLNTKGPAWQETFRLFRFVPFWLSFVFVGILITLSGAFDTFLIDHWGERALFVGISMFLSGIGCAVFSGFFHALTGQSALYRFDVVIKVGLLWVPYAAVPWRAAISYISDTPLTPAMILRSCIECYAIVLLSVSVLYFLKFGREVAKGKTTLHRILAFEPVPHPELQVPYYIESEDHYLKVVRSCGATYVRGTLNEVAAEFSKYGFRCHRSYWVSRHAVVSRRRNGRQLLLVLKDGAEIPVSRSYEKAVRDALD